MTIPTHETTERSTKDDIITAAIETLEWQEKNSFTHKQTALLCLGALFIGFIAK